MDEPSTLYILENRSVENVFREHIERRMDFPVFTKAKGYDTFLRTTGLSPVTFGTEVSVFHEAGLILTAGLSFSSISANADLELKIPYQHGQYRETGAALPYEQYLSCLFIGAVRAGQAIASHSHPDGYLRIAPVTDLAEMLAYDTTQALQLRPEAPAQEKSRWVTPVRR